EDPAGIDGNFLVGQRFAKSRFALLGIGHVHRSADMADLAVAEINQMFGGRIGAAEVINVHIADRLVLRRSADDDQRNAQLVKRVNELVAGVGRDDREAVDPALVAELGAFEAVIEILVRAIVERQMVLGAEESLLETLDDPAKVIGSDKAFERSDDAKQSGAV